MDGFKKAKMYITQEELDRMIGKIDANNN